MGITSLGFTVTGDLSVDCAICRKKGMCPDLAERCRLSLKAWVDGVDLAVCPGMEPNYYHGVEGVLCAPSLHLPS